jgi:hypothetical protein
MRFGVTIATILACCSALACGASAQTSVPTVGSDAARLVAAPWELSNADRDRVCTVNFLTARVARGFAVEFDAACAALFPVVKDIAAWSFADNDLLRLVDVSGKTLIEFGEVETGIFEAPTPGVGLLFLQAPGAAHQATRPADDMFGEWTMTRAGKPICTLTLDSNGADGKYPVLLRPNCDASIARQGFTGWSMQEGELLMAPANGALWRFEEVDAATFRRLPATTDIMLTRQ